METNDWLIITHKDYILLSFHELIKYYKRNKEPLNLLFTNLISIYKIGIVPTISLHMVKYIFKNI